MNTLVLSMLRLLWRSAIFAMGVGLGWIGLACAQSAAPAPTASAASAAGGPAATQHKDALRLIETWLDAQAAFERVPALSASAVVGQEVVWHKAWGLLDHQRQKPARSDTLYSICSISKLFTAIAVMQLWEDGKLSLDDDIAKLLPAFAIQRSDPDSGPISIRSLLMHASGLPREGRERRAGDTGYWSPPDFKFPSREELLRGVAEQKTFMRAGDHYQYSNLGLALLGEVVAAASGMPYEAYVQTRILDPLQLTDTRPLMPAATWGQRLAQGHGAIKRDGTRDALPLFDARGLTAAAGFSSSVLDLSRFAAWQFRLLKNGGKEILKVSTLREMHRVQWTDPDGKNSWGLGFGVGRDGSTTSVGHSGICPGYLSALSLVPASEVAVVVMANANDNDSLSRYSRPMRQLLMKGLKLPVAPSGADKPDLEAFSGRYRNQPWGSESVVQPWGAGLAILNLPNANPAEEMGLLKHQAGDSFRYQRSDGTLGVEITFKRDSHGRVTGYESWNHFTPRLAR
jgi:CubicO group peptidase (beta-lactamase class C family)